MAFASSHQPPPFLGPPLAAWKTYLLSLPPGSGCNYQDPRPLHPDLHAQFPHHDRLKLSAQISPSDMKHEKRKREREGGRERGWEKRREEGEGQREKKWGSYYCDFAKWARLSYQISSESLYLLPYISADLDFRQRSLFLQRSDNCGGSQLVKVMVIYNCSMFSPKWGTPIPTPAKFR